MKAAYYSSYGLARDVLRIGELPDPKPVTGEVRVRDAVGERVDAKRIGEKVWIWNAQRGRPFGTAAQYVALPADQAVPLPQGVSLAEGAGLGVPAMTAYFSLFDDGALERRDVLSPVAPGPSDFTLYNSRVSPVPGR